MQVAGTMKFYKDFRPTSAQLTEDEREVAERHLVTAARAMRALAGLDLTSPVPMTNGRPDSDLRTMIAGLRHYQRVLILTLSASPERRRLAIAGPQLEQLRLAAPQLGLPLDKLEAKEATD